ncbi:heme ABC transporter ATP-binding protein [Labrenzia sp. R4_2]|uniref:heme ABC transporter ATP-binding protein n=1 Tax=Labrenzia sp. R4_2 TaxID=2821107 RepID=UPI001ADBB704|nr:heme ABC transporter ATP-binding protein [Labrenzia sp. R4_2]MBO9420917.1 heme ABC transporter ATP-binding protein [Labrenzia sp. R4_2]
MTNTSILVEELLTSAQALDVRDVQITLGSSCIVNHMSFSAHSGELLAIIGPSGSGKTTLLKAITGERPYSGSIQLGGYEIASLSPEAQALARGVLPQASHLSFPLTVSEVIGLGILDRRQGRLARAHRIAEALALVGLPGFEARTYQDLSGGEQQRAQLARVICQVWDPVAADGTQRWLFLDEPVSSLDIKHQYQIMKLAKDYARRGGGVIAVMHDLNLTAAFADKILVMKYGAKVQHGSLENVFSEKTLTPTFEMPLDITRSKEGTFQVTPQLAELV